MSTWLAGQSMVRESCVLLTAEISAFSGVSGLRERRGLLGSNFTTFSIGGPIELVLEINSPEAAVQVIRILQTQNQSHLCLGAGSNLLISDSGLSKPVLYLGRNFKFVQELGQGRFRAGGAASLMSLSRDLSRLGYAGLEFAGGIPASIGGAVFMNAGAHGAEIFNILDSIECVLPEGELITIPPAELKFGYRRSGLPEGCLVLAATFKLQASDPKAVAERRASFLSERKLRQPLSFPSAGSIFKNPYSNDANGNFSAGKLIELAGLRGQKIGGAAISKMHGNWIINPERQAKAADVRALIQLCQKVVFESYAAELETEVREWSD